jgi:hypothetical protein
VLVADAPAHACYRLPGVGSCDSQNAATILEPIFEHEAFAIESTVLDVFCTPSEYDSIGCNLVAHYRVKNRGPTDAVSHAFVLRSLVGWPCGAPPAWAAGPPPYPGPGGADRFFRGLTLEDGGQILPVTDLGYRSETSDSDPPRTWVWPRDLVRRAVGSSIPRLAHGRKVGFALFLRAGEATDLVLRMSFFLRVARGVLFMDCDTQREVQHRHPIAAVGHDDGWIDLEYMAWTNRGADANGPVALRLHHPRAWRGYVDLFDPDGRLDDPPTPVQKDDGADDVVEQMLAPFTPKVQVFHLGFGFDPGPIYNGGPYFAAIWSFGPDSGMRARVGYEVAAPIWLLDSLSLETDVRREATLVPAAEAVTWGWIGGLRLIYGLGAGVPVRVRPETRVGGRLQLTASAGIVTLRGAFDLYPPTSNLSARFEGSVGPQVSF